MQLVFATNNLHKIKEVQVQLPVLIKLLSLQDVGITEDIPETSATIEGNALQKAQYVAQHWGYSCFADDTGLEVEALQRAPGVHSARYAGEQKSDQDNIRKLLQNLSETDQRQAQFKTVIALVIGKNKWLFEGICPGEITREPVGNNGFGYDPVFKPFGWEKTFAQMSLDEKNQISHRGKAVQQLVRFLQHI